MIGARDGDRRCEEFAGRLRDLDRRVEEYDLAFRLKSARDPDAPFRFRSVRCGEVRFESWHQGGAGTLEEPPRGDRYHLVIPNRSGGVLRAGKLEFQVEAGRSAALLSPWRSHEVWQGAGWRDVSVQLSANALRRHWERVTRLEVGGRIEFPSSIDLTSRGGGRVRRLVEFMARESERVDGLMHAPASRERLVETLQTVLLTQIPHSHSKWIREEPEDRGPRIVRQAEEFMAEQPGKPVRMGDVAACVGVSLRSLQESFRRHRGYGPLDFLQWRRLELARQRLRTDRETSITAIAIQCGFSHASHFGAAYKRHFDETPSETRASARFR